MKKVNMLKKLLSFGLALALFITSPASVYAAQVEESTVEAVSENKEEVAAETPATNSGEEKSESDIPSEGKDDSASLDNPAEGTEVNNEDQSIIDKVVDAVKDALGLNEDEKTEKATEEDGGLHEVPSIEDENSCEHSSYRYESNGDGTHKKICTDCEEVVAEAEPCEFDENGICTVCGYADPEHKFTLTDANGIVKVTGTKAVLNGATKVVAEEITVESNADEFEKVTETLEEEASGANKTLVDFVAYDINLYNDANDPVKIEGNVSVVFTNLDVTGLDDSSCETKVYHYKNESVDAMNEVATVSEDTVQMTTNHFSTYIVAVNGGKNNGIYSSDYVTIEGKSRNWFKENSVRTVYNSRGSFVVYNNNKTQNNYRILYVSIFVNNEERTDDTLGKLVATFDSASNEKFVVTPAEGYKLDKVCFAYAGPNDQYLLNYTDYGINTSYDINGIKNYLEVTGNGKNRTYTGNTNYLEVFLTTDSSVSINGGDLLKDGTLKAELTEAAKTQNADKEIKYQWSKQVGNGAWTECENVEYQRLGDSIAEDWINIVLDKGTLTDTVSSVKYKVEAYYLDANNQKVSLGSSAEYDVEHYNELRNGSFETPVLHGNGETGDQKDDYWWAPQVSNDYYKQNGGVWQTTGLGSINNKSGKDIEILNTDYQNINKNGRTDNNSRKQESLNAFAWEGDTAVAADGVQFAEINCEAEGALYQDVLTINGEQLNYWLSHRARGKNRNKVEYDTMYVVIMPVSIANDNNLHKQENLTNYLENNGYNLSNLGAGQEYYNSNTGVYVKKITSPDNKWSDYEGTYIPTAYATRFYFLSGETAAISKSIGNFIDKVGFSQKMPPVADKKFGLSITKTIKGLSDDTDALNQLKNSLQFKVTTVDANGNTVSAPLNNQTVNASAMTQTTTDDGVVLSYKFADQTIENNEYYYIIEELNPALDGYDLTSDVSINKNDVAQIVTINDKQYAKLKSKANARFDFTNEYEKKTYSKSISIQKTWEGGAPTNVSATFKLYGTYKENGTTKYVVKDSDELTTTKTPYLTETLSSANKADGKDNVWTKSLGDDFPVFVDNNTSKLITWVVEEVPVAGYKASEDDVLYGEDKVVIEEDSSLPAAATEPGEGSYDHIDIECWTANETGAGANGTIEKIWAAEGTEYYTPENAVTVIGYLQNGTWVTEKRTLSGYYDSGNKEWKINFKSENIRITKNTKIAFKVKFKDVDEIKTVVLTKASTYPTGVSLNDPGESQYDNYLYICKYLNKTGRPSTVSLDGESVYEVSINSCPGNAEPDLYAENGGHGIDLVLTPKTITTNILTNKTGDEIHRITNTKSTAKLTISKYAVDGKDQSDPSNDAKYQFEIKKVNGESLESVSVNGVTNDTFKLGGRDKIDLNVPSGTYKITEKAVVYDDNTTVQEKDRLTLKNFSTRVVVNEDSESPIKSDVMSRTTETREYTVEVKADTTVKFENLLYKEEKTEIAATNRKYAIKNADGTYDLTLEFTAPGVQISSYETVVNEIAQSGSKYDVVVVLDTSSSLSSNDLRDAKSAINNMVNSTSDKNVDILWKLVTFNTEAQILNNNTWSNNANNQFTNLVSNVTNTGNGTNYEDAFEKVIQALPSNRDNDNVKPRKVVIFVTDGAPNQDNHGHNAGSTAPTYYGYDSAKTKAASVKCDYFYALGVGLTDTKNNLGNNVSLSSKEILNNIIANIDASTLNKKVLNVTQYSEVSGALTEFTQGFLTNYSVANEMNTTTYATKAVITDVLTDYVDFAKADDRYTVKVMNGQTPVTNIDSEVNDDGKTVTATFTAPANADLSNYIYSVTFTIKATDAAYDYLLEKQSYPVDENNNVTKGEAETGTHAGEEGFFSNVSADVVFTLLKEETTPLSYNKPVIQIAKIFGWEISKISSSTKNALGGAEFLLKNDSNTYYGQSDTNGKVSWFNEAAFATAASIVPGTYTLTETKAPEGYAKTEQTWEVKVSKSAPLVVTSGNQTIATVETNSNLANEVPMSVAKLTIENNVAYTLPETGGRGVYVYTIGGVLLMLGASLMLYKNKKNKNK